MSFLQKYKYYFIVAVLAASAIVLASLALALKPHTAYTYYTVENISRQYICSECHEKTLPCSKEVMPHEFLPHSFDHNIHLEAAKIMAREGRQANKLYPSCYSCHKEFRAEKGLTKTLSINLCTKCHNPLEEKFHEKVYEKELSCIMCHSDWSGKNSSVRLKFLTTSQMCLECHTHKGVNIFSLSEIHRFHSKITDCSTCHNTYVTTHDQFFHNITATPKTACSTCHTILGLHGLHYEKKPGVKCSSCHVKGVGALSFEKKTEPLLSCRKCHTPTNTTLHDLIKEDNLAYYHCIKCHEEWIDAQPKKYRSVVETCSICHPSSFAVDRAYGLHKVHLEAQSSNTCTACHSLLESGMSHKQWFASARSDKKCVECHSLSSLLVTHKSFFEKTKDCFTSGCHGGYLWKWPPPSRPQ